MEIYTIGHSNIDFRDFVKLLDNNGISILVDVRSHPYSKSEFARQFDRPALERGLEFYNVTYKYMGGELGGKPDDLSLYTNGEVDYEKIAVRPEYLEAIKTLMELAERQRVAIMCSEGDHKQCHRHKLIAKTLVSKGWKVLHIQRGGEVVMEDELQDELQYEQKRLEW